MGINVQTVPLNYATRVCNMIGQLGARGISVLESSGDTGTSLPTARTICNHDLTETFPRCRGPLPIK